MPPSDEHGVEASGSTRAAEDLVDAATGLDGRALTTLRDLVLRPWEMIRRAAFDNDRRYVGAVKLSLAMSTVAIVMMGWLISSETYIEGLRLAEPEKWAELEAQLQANGICIAHFTDRFWSRHEILNTAATLLECGVFALVFRAFDRTRPYISHLGFALYCYSLWLLASVPLQLVVVADIAGSGAIIGLGMLLLLPALYCVGLWRLYPAPWGKQLGGGLLVLVLTALLFALSSVAISIGAMAWTRASFGI